MAPNFFRRLFETGDDPSVIDVLGTDAEMNAAIARARATLAAFWASYDEPYSSEDGHCLKVQFAYAANKFEHIWMAEVKETAPGRYSGRFANDPCDLPGQHAGDMAEFGEADITDWMFLCDDKIVGAETMRPLLKSMPKADADALRARLQTP